MNDQCQCISRATEMCCPIDAELRKAWLKNLEKEHETLKRISGNIMNKLKILSNSDRIEILLMLEQREHCLEEIARKLDVKKSAVSYHLRLLNENGMICKKKHSRFAFYSLSSKGSKIISIF